ncbi:N5-carboxyaminoimidazole ribonucleotide synthase [Betaproteobacteria bacterium]|nr:N5-carboxyaminoimidazole ribonucleotide synthase [Betaproteobacteria bacterium]GHU41706.1 N5-carboxyaminoimidazole ribonucleotide synthase [Betaproteobacteria bacterium]
MSGSPMLSPILPPATLGMLGGGQLGRFFVAAAHELGYKVWVLDPDQHSPAGRIADRHLCAAYEDAAALDELAAGCAAVTTEFENVPAATLSRLAERIPVRPAAAAVSICQQRINEKSFLRDNGFPHGAFASIESAADIENANAGLFPGILKVARFGYDGKGQVVVEDRAAALAAFQKFKGEACVLEQKLTLDYEISIVLARDAEGRVAAFPPAENQHGNGILDVSIVPARSDACLVCDAEDIARRIAEKLAYIGVLAVEFFVSRGRLYVNEMAPRPHNSGHYTLDACVSSQYEQQVRALCGLPLGESRAHSVSVMVNLLGDLWFASEQYREPDWSTLAAIPNLKLHLYGKSTAKPGRKMGHFTVVGEHLDKALATALAAREAIGILGG